MKNVIKVLALLLFCLPLAAQIPSGFVQVTATVPSLANGSYGVAWTNQSGAPQLPLLGCVSAFQTTINGQFDSNGSFTVLVAANNQICPSPSTWTWSFTFHCTGESINGGFQVPIAISGGGTTQNISAAVTAALPSNPCSGGGGGGGGGGSPVSPPAFTVQAANGAATSLTSDPAITINTSTHSLDVGGPISTNFVTIGPHTTPPASWTFDTYTPQTACNSIGCFPFVVSSLYSTFASACAAAVSGNQILFISNPWPGLPSQTCAANLFFNASNPGVNFLQPASGQTLVLTGAILAPPTKIFDVSVGTISLGSTISMAPVEWFGAIGDATGAAGVGTNNTAAIQVCLNALTNGQCMLLNQQYRTTSALSIAKSNVGIGGVSYQIANSSLYPTPVASTIVIDSASADAVDVAGTNMTANITYNRFTDFTINRTVIPTGSARGLSSMFTYGEIIQGVTSNDSIAPFYFHGVASQGTGYIENCAATFGYYGFAETTSGNYGGFIIDSTGGSAPNNSFRIRNVFVAENSNISHTGGVVIYGVDVTGSNVNDFHSFHVETAGVDYGIAVGTSSPTFGNSSDIFISESVLDQCWISAISLSGIVGGVTVNGGDFVRADSTTSNTPIVDIENSNHVTITNAGFNSNNTGTTAPSLLVHGSGSIRVIGNDFGVNYGDGIDFTTSVASTIANNILNGFKGGTSGISLTTSSVNNTITGNTINTVSPFTLTNGVLIDSTSTGIRGIETNQIATAGITNRWSDTSNNASIHEILNNSATLIYTAITNGTSQNQTMTVTGALVNNRGVACSPQASLGGNIFPWNSYVSAANTVTVSVANISASPATPSAVAWGCTVSQ